MGVFIALPAFRPFAENVTSRHGENVGFVSQHAVKGFPAELPQPAIDAASRNPTVLAVTPDRMGVSIAAAPLDIPAGYDRIEADLATPWPILTPESKMAMSTSRPSPSHRRSRGVDAVRVDEMYLSATS